MQTTAHLQSHIMGQESTESYCQLLGLRSSVQAVQKGHETAPNKQEVILTKMMHGDRDLEKLFKLVKLSAGI